MTIEFPFTTAQSFEFALAAAQELPTFEQFGGGTKAVYRVTLTSDSLQEALPLVEQLKGWRRRTVYLDGEKMPWDSVFGFNWCYTARSGSFNPQKYCFGDSQDWQANLWGCIQAQMPFNDHARWLTWGRWVNDKGDWQFDKQRILHELQKNLHPYRFCPALDPDLVADVVAALPDIINPNKNKNWKFVQGWGDDSQVGLVVTIREGSYRTHATMIGVGPAGSGALAEIAKKLRNRIPSTF